MAANNSNLLVEKLIATVARAFYSDNYVVVLDTLIHEKYIREEEIAPRLKMIAKDVRKVISHLEADMLIKHEEMIMDDGRTSKCYYIDYQLFVNVIRYRVYMMKKAITSSEKSVLNDVFYHCPTCKETVSSLDAQKLRNFEFKFICLNCCPHEDFRTSRSEPYFVLVEQDKNLNSIQATFKRFEYQLYRTKSSSLSTTATTTMDVSTSASTATTTAMDHEGIFNLLSELKDIPLIRNLPSANRHYGITASKISDEEVQNEITENIGYKRVSKDSLNRINKTQIVMGQEIKEKDSFHITFEDSSTVGIAGLSSQSGGGLAHQQTQQIIKKQALNQDLPEFLVDSRVITAEHLQMKLQQQSQQQRQQQQSQSLSAGGGSDSSTVRPAATATGVSIQSTAVSSAAPVYTAVKQQQYTQATLPPLSVAGVVVDNSVIESISTTHITHTVSVNASAAVGSSTATATAAVVTSQAVSAEAEDTDEHEDIDWEEDG